MVNYHAEAVIYASRNIIERHKFGLSELKTLVKISRESKGKFLEASSGLDYCRNIISKENFEKVGLILAKYAAMGYGKYFSIVLEGINSEDDVFKVLSQLPVKVEKSENYTVQGLNALGFMCCHVTNASGGFGTHSKVLYRDPFDNIVTNVNNAADYNPFASIIHEGGKSTLTELAHGNLGGQVGIIYDYGYIFESQLGTREGKEVVDKKSGISRRTFYIRSTPSVPPFLTATGKVEHNINNVVLLRKWTVSGIFYTKGCSEWTIERLKKLSDDLSFREYINGAYWYRVTPHGTPPKIIKVFPVYEIEYGTNESKIVFMPQNTNYEVRLDKSNNNTWIAIPLGQSQFANDVEGDYFPYEFYSRLHHISTGTDSGIAIEGTFGQSGAGILIVTKNLREVMLLKRSPLVLDPNLWGIAGGARKQTGTGMEDAIVTAVAEAKEEIGGLPKGRIRKVSYAYKKPGTNFTYHTFILEIEPEERINFKPELNYENVEWKWFTKEELKELNTRKQIHLGVADVLRHLSIL